MNAIINKNAINKVAEAFPDLTVKQIVDIITLNVQGKLGLRKTGRKVNLKKDKVHHVVKKYRDECSKTQLKPSRLELEVNSLDQKVEGLRSIDELKAKKEELVKRELLYSLKIQGSLFVGNLIKRKVMKDFTKEPDFAETIHYALKFWISEGLDTMLLFYEISAPELLDTFNQWYCPGTQIYPTTGRFATGEECLALEIYSRMSSLTDLLRELDESARKKLSEWPLNNTRSVSSNLLSIPSVALGLLGRVGRKTEDCEENKTDALH
jgi:hypothetical protein